MATKRIKAVKADPFTSTIQLLYDDGTRGEVPYEDPNDDERGLYVSPEALVGLTLKQAKMRLGLKASSSK